jgi:hypothetical protein
LKAIRGRGTAEANAPWAPGGEAGSTCVPSCHSLKDVIVIASASARIAACHIES